MGQLIKLQDYISRYEQDIYRYPSQFVRLKQQQWEKLKTAYTAGELVTLYAEQEYVGQMEAERGEKKGLFNKVKGLIGKGTKDLPEYKEKPSDETNVFSLKFPTEPKSLDDLKQNYLNQLLKFQLKWGSSTIHEKSWMDNSYILDEKLRFFLQRFPDTYLVLYKPIFVLKNAPIELEVILLGPTDVWCITFLEAEEDAAFIGSNERFWLRRHHQYPDKKLLNPLIALNRTGKIVSQLFELYEISLPIHKVVLSRNGYIDYPQAPYDITFLDKRVFPEWFEKMRSVQTPLKHQQLKAAQGLLEYCQTTSSRRLEWDVDQHNQFVSEDESPKS
ncbi:NERD domain-containing protein [Peribacillus loiseleuriae]|uniref:NERD domain-containing protein n=1 Tax=Peribacillus loiseleuriae TaxID=1679170 RepID=UPI003CFE2E0C